MTEPGFCHGAGRRYPCQMTSIHIQMEVITMQAAKWTGPQEGLDHADSETEGQLRVRELVFHALIDGGLGLIQALLGGRGFQLHFLDGHAQGQVTVA